ncbi:hypothetical protein [Spirosoma areae]
MNPPFKNDRERMEHLFTKVGGAQYIFYQLMADLDYRVLVQTPVGVKNIHVPRRLLGEAVLSSSDRNYICQQLSTASLLEALKQATPDEINLPDIPQKAAPDSIGRRFLSWLGFRN